MVRVSLGARPLALPPSRCELRVFERGRGHRESEHKEMRITIPNLTDDVKCEMFNRRDDVKQLKKRETRACNSRRL